VVPQDRCVNCQLLCVVFCSLNGFERARLLNKLADLIEQLDEIAALETLDNGKPSATHSKKFDVMSR
jgi:acyl-CoA reductase-like NAD-dependent aldehyde dehydrogenase